MAITERIDYAIEQAEMIKHHSMCDDSDLFVKNGVWKRAGLSVPIPENTISNIALGIINHDLVSGYFVEHSNEADFYEKYFYRDNEVKYFYVLDLAERELGACFINVSKEGLS